MIGQKHPSLPDIDACVFRVAQFSTHFPMPSASIFILSATPAAAAAVAYIAI
jgi:hypothetical protein